MSTAARTDSRIQEARVTKVMGAIPLTFRATAELVEQTDQLARVSGMSRSDYLRKAIEEKNQRTLAERMAFLSGALSAEHLEINEAMHVSLKDGLAGR